eukprot:GHUV01026958.1.p4 GENE.GHUV01026958.1~~GHUV01026958.1.p4  ORF type:complete len:105 (-),score=24.42 GHUV01026958.1:198-512(-)
MFAGILRYCGDAPGSDSINQAQAIETAQKLLHQVCQQSLISTILELHDVAGCHEKPPKTKPVTVPPLAPTKVWQHLDAMLSTPAAIACCSVVLAVGLEATGAPR